MRIASCVCFLVFVLCVSGCEKTDGTHKARSEKSAKDVVFLKVPDMPPGFESITELGKFDIFDWTKNAHVINKKILLSASWDVEKKYSKAWEEFSDQEKQDFDALVESLVVKLSHGVKTNGGVFSVERPKEGFYAGAVIGSWEVRHDPKYAFAVWEAPHRWKVTLNAMKTTIGTPVIVVYISQCIIDGEK